MSSTRPGDETDGRARGLPDPPYSFRMTMTWAIRTSVLCDVKKARPVGRALLG